MSGGYKARIARQEAKLDTLIDALTDWYGCSDRPSLIHYWEIRTDSDVPMAAAKAKAVYDALRACEP